MVDFRDRRRDQPDFADGTGPFTLTTHGYAEHDRWSGMDPSPQAKREVQQYYRTQKGTQTWKRANSIAARRTRRSSGRDAKTAADYASEYQDNLVRVMSTRGPDLARQFGEIHPGR